MDKNHFFHIGRVAALVPILLFCWSCGNSPKVVNFEQPPKTTADLEAHSHEFEKQIVEVTNGVYVAIGYGLANSIMLEGKDSIIIVDCLESYETGKTVLAEFRKITDKPIAAIVYTHNHADHVFGARAFAEGAEPQVIAHELMPYLLDRIATVIRPIIEKRSYRMFGNLLDDEAVVNCGIGKRLNFTENTLLDVVRPTITFKDSLKITIAGIEMHLHHAPGETDDQLFVWLPQKQALLCADNFYRSFPNLYTIRGTAYRDMNKWKQSLDKIRFKKAKYLVPSHTRPISGGDTIWQILTDYRDAIQFVHDQSIRLINEGHTPDEMAEMIRLPSHLGQSPYLQEFYGTVEWSVRSVFEGYLGFFDGNPSTLFPLPPLEKAEKMARLAGGIENLKQKMASAHERGEAQWALELSDFVLRLLPEDTEATQICIAALTQLGEAQSNPNARHYYLTAALELQGLQNKSLTVPSTEMAHRIPMSTIFDGLAVRLIPEKCLKEEKTVVFKFTDTGEAYTVQVRRGVAETQPFALPNADITLTTTAKVWKEIAAELRNPLTALAKGDLKVDGGLLELKGFLGWFGV